MVRWGLAALALSVLAGAARAQSSVDDYQLPPSARSTANPVQGPVDPDHPLRARPEPANPDARASPRPGEVRAAAPPRAPAPAVSRDTRSHPAPAPAHAAADTPEPRAAEAAPAPSAPPAAPQARAVRAPVAQPQPRDEWPVWPIAALLAGVSAALTGVALARRAAVRARPALPSLGDDAAAPDPIAPPRADPVFTPFPRPPPRRTAPPLAQLLDVRLEADALSLSLVYATLAYRLTLGNACGWRLGPLAVAGDLISAHASLPDAEQLSLDHHPLAPGGELAALAPGKTVTLEGELRLALAGVRPVRSAGANLFVPLARFRITDRASGAVADRVFAVGQRGLRADAALRPVNLDLGPRTIRVLDQRALAAPA